MSRPEQAFEEVRWPASFNEIPKDIFHRQDVYRRELERIFYGEMWHPVAHVSEVPENGDYKTGQIGEAPVLVVRGDDGVVRAFFNSCAHRGTQLRTCSRGTGKEIECPYHRWVFSNQGELMSAPGMPRFPNDFAKQKFGLTQLRTGEVAGLIFATCSKDAPELDAFLGVAKDGIFKALGGDGRLKLLGYQKVIYDSNWKEYNDNEGYHAPLLHSAFRLLRWGGGKGTQCQTPFGHQVIEAELRTSPNNGFLDDYSLVELKSSDGQPKSHVIALFPMVNVINHLDTINIRFAMPVSVDQTEVHYAYFSHQDDSAALAKHRLRQASNLLGPSGFISLEDGAVFNRVHVGSNALGHVTFVKGVDDPEREEPNGDNPVYVEQNDEAGNPIKWDYYRRVMGFERE